MGKIKKEMKENNIVRIITPLITSKNLNVKHLAYHLINYVNNDDEQLILVNPCLKDFLEISPLIKALSLKNFSLNHSEEV